MDELCQYLRSERLRLGLSLQDVARKAKISISLLKALEQGRFLEIGPPPLVHSHLLAYSRALGVNQLPSTHEQAPQPAPAASASLDPPEPQDSPLAAKRTGVQRLMPLLIIGLLALGVCYHISRDYSPDRGNSSNHFSDKGASPESSVRTEMPSGASASADTERSLEEPSNPAENHDPPDDSERAFPATEQEAEKRPLTTFSTRSTAVEESGLNQPVSLDHRFEIEALQESWVEVKIESRKTERFLLRPGERREWRVVGELQVLLGNAGGVLMNWDGVSLDLGARPGQVLRFRLPHPNLAGKSPEPVEGSSKQRVAPR